MKLCVQVTLVHPLLILTYVILIATNAGSIAGPLPLVVLRDFDKSMPTIWFSLFELKLQ